MTFSIYSLNVQCTLNIVVVAVTQDVSSLYGLHQDGINMWEVHTIPSCSTSNQSVGFFSAAAKKTTQQKPDQLSLTKEFLPAFLYKFTNIYKDIIFLLCSIISEV